MTNDRDSLNAFLGIVGYLTKSWFPKGLIWGLPLEYFPQSLRWYHPRWVKPRRRPGFPSWSWTGWEGQAIYSGSLSLVKMEERGRIDITTESALRFISIDHQILTLEGEVVKLEIRTDPFSDAYVPGTDYLLGPMKERNLLHNNTLPSQTTDFLVIEKVRYRPTRDRPFRQDVFLIMLDWDGAIAVRRTKVRLFLGPEVDFAKAPSQIRRVQLK